MSKLTHYTIASFVVCLVFGARCLYSQSTAVFVSGTISDPSGAVVANAIVTARNVDTGVVTTATTNDSGVYVFPPLLYGKYEFTAEHARFSKAVTENVLLEAGTKLTLNKVLQVGTTSDTVEVQASASTLTASTASIGGTVEGRRVEELPITGRDAMNFLFTQAGMGSNGTGFDGTRSSALNVTTDGIATLSNRIDGINTTGIVTSSGLLGTTAFQDATRVDRVEEVHILSSPADVEYGRGLGQLQLVTRSGGNAFHGSVFEEHRDTDLNANNWFSNAAGTNAITALPIQPRQILVSNQFGGRVGGPIKRNKTFFNFYYEGQRQIAKNNVIAGVLTAAARQGIFRFFPGVTNSNAASAVPTVTTNGTPIAPAAATGPLQSLSIFGLDPNHPGLDPSGVIAQNIKNMPLPNYFLSGDGLNTAGFSWLQPTRTQFDTFEGRIDHNFSDTERLQLSYNHIAWNTGLPGALPTSPAGKALTASLLGTIVLNSVLRPNLLNEIRIGIYRPQIHVYSGYDPSTGGPSALYEHNGSPYLISPLTFSPIVPIDSALDGYANVTPNYQYGEAITWIKGKHSFKGGFEARLISYAGYDIANVVPRVYLGAGTTPTNLSNTLLPGVGTNLGTAQSLLYDLSGAVSLVSQTLNAPSGSPNFLPGLTRYALIKQPEYSWYFKDDIKVTPSFTLNLGIRYELFQVPYEAHGNFVAPAGGGYSLFGISGNSYATAEFHPGVLNGQLITPIQIGPNGPNPNVSLFKGDHNNFAPGVGFAWDLPWLGGRGKTVFRAGYGVSYDRTPIYVTQLQTVYAPGLGQTFTNTPTVNTNLANVSVPVTPTNAPLQQIPLNSNPFASRQLTFSTFDPNLRTPYIQNWQASISRALPGNARLEVRYVGTKGTKLIRGTNVNETNVVENGIANAFNIVRAGGDSPLIDQIFGRYAASGQTGSQLVLTNSATNGFFASNNVGGFANFINNSFNFTGVAGGLLVNAGLPENFVTASPQYATEYLLGNNGGSTYNALQVEYTKRYSGGLILQSNFTYNRYLGDYNGGDDSGLTTSFDTLRNRNLNKALLDRKFFWRSNGLYELPFGPGKLVGRDTSGVVAKVIGGWQLGSIFYLFSGYPISFGMVNSTFNTVGANNLPNISGPVPSGSIQKVGTGVIYYGNFSQITDPQVAGLASQVRALSPLRAIVNSSGQIILSNALPGTIGNLAPGAGIGPGYFQFDMNLIKKVRITERTELWLGANATNVLNHPQFANPSTVSIDSTSFGRITSTIIPNRVVVLTGRITF